ncbi:MAG: hypothetical protein V3W18_00810 [candidate division Zixibacteria bacterium]
MSLDIVEIALDNMTDFNDFEKLASEIMRDEGYPEIIPLGGKSDLGRDAIEERFLRCDSKILTVFQYTLQLNISLKIKETIEKLAEADISFGELVIVTPRKISTQRQDDLIDHARRKFGVNLRIFERKTLVNRLSNYDNGIFNRHFPNIEQQLLEIKTNFNSLVSEQESELETSLLRAAISLTFNRDSEKARNSIFDQLTLSIVLDHYPDFLNKTGVFEKLSEIISLNKPSNQQLVVSLQRLHSNGFISYLKDSIRPTKLAINTRKAIMVEVNEATNSLISDIVGKVTDLYEGSLKNDDENILIRNAKNTLMQYFRLYGLELSHNFLHENKNASLFFDTPDIIFKEANQNLTPKLGTALMNAIGDLFAHPPIDHINTLAHWSLAFIGIQIMNLDPMLHELEKSCFSKKTFILDTDFVLDCIVLENPKNSIYLQLVNDLLNIGCTVIIPDAVITECITHAEISNRTFSYFSDSLFGYDASFVEEMVWNAFVKGYYYSNRDKNSPARSSYANYLSNYYDKKRPGAYFNDVISNILPEKLVIKNPTTLLSNEIPEKELKEFQKQILGLMSQTKKDFYRSEQERQDLAETDARFFLTALYLNRDDDKHTTNDMIFGGLFYILTTSTKHIKAALRAGIKDVVTVQPQSIISILEVIGISSGEPAEIISLFENPFLIRAVMESKDEVKKLVESGLDLRDKSLVRLRWDLDDIFHAKLALIDQLDSLTVSAEESDMANSGEDEYLKLIGDAIGRGYKLNPVIRSLFDRLRAAELNAVKKEVEINQLKTDFETIETKFEEFGKRKQRFLRRFARRGKD